MSDQGPGTHSGKFHIGTDGDLEVYLTTPSGEQWLMDADEAWDLGDDLVTAAMTCYEAHGGGLVDPAVAAIPAQRHKHEVTLEPETAVALRNVAVAEGASINDLFHEAVTRLLDARSVKGTDNA